MTDFNKPVLIDTIAILLSLGKESVKDLSALKKETLQEIYDSYIINAKQSNANAFQQHVASSGSKTSTETGKR